MFAEDLSLFFGTQDFATAVTLDGTTVNGILSQQSVEVNFVQTIAPTFVYQKADKPTVAIDSTLVNGAVTYKVKGIQADITQTVSTLVLEKQ